MRQKSSNQLLLTTKLTIPPTRSNLVNRPRLFNKLEASKEHPLTLLAAPAGFGKSVALSAWAQQQKSVSWVSLDSSDNDPVQFWSYMLSAIDTLSSGHGAEPLSMLQSEQPASIETVLVTMINTLDASEQQESVLILDDYHSIEQLSIHRALTFLLDHLPMGFHLIIASRVDPPLPLSRLRARHQLLELRVDDLRFTFAEAATFLNDTMGLHLTAEDIAALEIRTEGWVAGLQLAALSMQGRGEIASFVSTFTGSHRYIVDYLTEEVLGQQSEHIRSFLLQTSILDRLNGSLCDEVTGQRNGQIMLEQLEQANLFLVPLDDERHWYRYHHLFAEALRFRLNQAHPDLIPILYQRASTWFESHGFISDAINHTLAAHDFERAAALIEPILYQMFSYGTHATVRHWLQALPEEVLFTHPTLCLQYAWAFLYVGEIKACQRPLEVAERAWRADGNLSRLGEVYIFQSSMALVQGDANNALNYAQQALPLLSDADLISRCNYATYTGASYLLLGNIREASHLLNEALMQCHPVHLYSTLYTMNFLAEMQFVQSKLRQAVTISQEVISKLAGRASIHSSLAFSKLGRISRERNELDQAAHHMQQAVTLGEQAGQDIYMSPIYLASAQIHWTRGELREALMTLDKAEQAAMHLGHHRAIEQARTFRAHMELAEGNLTEAERWSDEINLDVSEEPVYEHETAYLMFARLRIAQSRAKETVGLLERLLAADEAAGRSGNAIHVRAMLALVQWEMGNSKQAMRILDHLIAEAEPEGYVRVFADEGPPMQAILASWLSTFRQQRSFKGTLASVEYVKKLLAAFPPLEALPTESLKSKRRRETGNSETPLLEPLTTREQDVLELLALGLPNAEIAERLIVTVGTVKTHIKSIYGKLGVHNRTQAIAHAREVGLL